MSETNEQHAREMGWRPREEFKGDPDKWVDADEFVRRGEEMLPLVRAENRRLTERADEMTREIQRLTAVVAENQTSMRDFAAFAAEQLRDRLDEQRRDILARLREAKRDEDDALVGDLEASLEDNKERREALKTPARPPAQAPAPQQGQPQRHPNDVTETPEYRVWRAANPWFNGSSRADQAKTAAAERFAIEAANAGKRGKAFFDAVDDALNEVYPPQRRTDHTEEGRPSGGGGGQEGGEGFASLPADAKAKAREQSAKFVGANKMFKTEKDWFSYFAKQYRSA